MKNKVAHLGVLLVALIVGLLCANNKDSLILFETNLPSAVGALTGGVIAAVTLYLTIISNRLEKKELDNLSKQRIAESNKQLRDDVFVLIFCFALTVLIPVFRATLVFSDPNLVLPPFIHTVIYGTGMSAAFLYAIATTVECVDVMFHSVEAIYLSINSSEPK